jgi:hypothetical protein
MRFVATRQYDSAAGQAIPTCRRRGAGFAFDWIVPLRLIRAVKLPRVASSVKRSYA